MEIAQKHGFNIIDELELVPPMHMFFLPDLLHPNSLGYSLYTKYLIEKL